jgi:TatD DNase family protein
MFFDSHCHLDHPLLSGDLPGLLAAAKSAGISRFMVPGVAPSGWPAIASLSGLYPEIYPAFGVHPMHAPLLTPETASRLLWLAPRAAAIGEIGLDYTLGDPPRETQRYAFRAQLRLAVQTGLPVLIHCRKAFPDLLEIMREEGVGRVGGVMHAFSGSAEIAQQCLRLGLHISLAGTVTYQNAVRPVAVARAVPLERLLLETDAPDLTPEPRRGSVNLPEYLRETAARVAKLRGIGLEELAESTTENALRLFGTREAQRTI